MFKKKENVIEFDFNGLNIKAKAVDVAIAHSKAMESLNANTPDTMLNAEQIQTETKIIKEFLKDIFGAATVTAIIKQVWGDEKPDYYSYADLFVYIVSELTTFARNRMTING